MKKSALVLAVLAAGLSSAAVAKDLKGQAKATVSAPAQMSDAEMDRVTAGTFVPGSGTATAQQSPGGGNAYANGLPYERTTPQNEVFAGQGVCTTSRSPQC